MIPTLKEGAGIWTNNKPHDCKLHRCWDDANQPCCLGLFPASNCGNTKFSEKESKQISQPFKKQKAAVRCYVGARAQESGSSGFKSQSLPARCLLRKTYKWDTVSSDLGRSWLFVLTQHRSSIRSVSVVSHHLLPRLVCCPMEHLCTQHRYSHLYPKTSHNMPSSPHKALLKMLELQ